MKLAYKAFIATLLLLTLVFLASAQTPRTEKDPRNTTSTVSGGERVGGPTGLFGTYDGQVLRKGEFTFSAALSNYDRDPGDVDITTIPLSFQIGLTDHIELFFNADAYRRIHVNSPRNLSSFYLPNTLAFGGVNAPAIVLSPQGPGVSLYPNQAIFRPTGAPFVSFPYSGGNAGTFGLIAPFFSGPQFGFPAGTNALLGPPNGSSGRGAAAFPGVGSVFGSILPGVVLATVSLTNPAGGPAGEAPSFFTLQPSYLPNAPFVNTRYAATSMNSFEFGTKIRFNNVNNAVGYGVVAFYRYNVDKATSLNGFAQLQRGSGTGGNRGDFGVFAFADARLAWWVNLSANIGIVHNSSVKGTFPNGQFTLLDRPDELQSSLALDFPVNRHFQWIAEFLTTHYVGGRTPNAFEVNPMDLIGGLRFYPKRWWGIGVAYRRNMNQTKAGSFSNTPVTTTVFIPCRPNTQGCTPQTITNTFTGVPTGFRTSDDANGIIAQIWVGKRDKRQSEVVNRPADVDSVDLSNNVITLGCRPGTRPAEGLTCPDNATINVSTKAHDPDNDPLTYEYTVSGGRIIGSGASVQWDLSGAQAGTYTITAGVNDGCGICGKTQSKTITIRDCPRCVPVEACPDYAGIDGPSGITQPGDTMTFTARVSGGTGNYTYNWTVSAGTIESGQGTQSIVVRTNKDMAGTNVTATMELGGTPPGLNCKTTDSASAGVDTRVPRLITECPESSADQCKPDKIKAYLDALNIALANSGDSDAKGYIVIYGNAKQTAALTKAVKDAIKFRKYDASKYTIVAGGDTQGGPRVKLWLIPTGAQLPPK